MTLGKPRHANWTVEQLAPVIALADTGYSYREIARVLKLTRSTIAGQLLRNGYYRGNDFKRPDMLPPPELILAQFHKYQNATPYSPLEEPQSHHVHRYTYAKYATEPAWPYPPRQPRPKNRVGVTETDVLKKLMTAGIPRYVAPPPSPAPNSRFLPLVALSEHDCKFAVGEDDSRHLFCGAPALELKPYCRFHCNIAYVPLRPLNAYVPT